MRDRFHFKPARRRHTALAVATLLSLACAHPAPVFAEPVVQRLPGPEAARLNAALTRLAENPRDVTGLIEAGDAALDLGDFEAAEGFFRRAVETEPGNARAMAGLAGALVLSGNPYAAIPLFERAAKAGVDTSEFAAERGLAYDLVGANASAQELYRKALARDSSGEIRRRLALSLAIGGDAAAADAMLLPQLRAQDKPAWRTRAFVLAITGKTKEAVDVTNTLLPADLAQHIVPYLRYMPQLTPAQQAAAANLGKFPRASDIGQDDPRIASFASLATPRTRLAAVDLALIPQGEPLGGGKKRAGRRGSSNASSSAGSDSKSKPKREKRNRRGKGKVELTAQAQEPRVAPPEPRPARETTAPSQPSPAVPSLAVVVEKPVVQSKPVAKAKPLPQVAVVEPRPVSASPPGALAVAVKPDEPPRSLPLAADPEPAEAQPGAAKVDKAQPEVAASAPSAPAANQPAAAVAASLAAAKPASEPAFAIAAPAPGFDLAKLPSSSSSVPAGPAVPSSSTPPPSAPPAGNEPEFADLFGDLGRPAVQAVPAAGAVDIRKIEPARPEPKPKPEKPAPKPAPPSHPSRIWVQLGVGQNISALKFDWRRLNRQQTAQFKGRKAYVSDLGRTNRMLTGPFESRKAANNFLADLSKAGLDGPYLWISPAGQVVDEISN